jgi:PAP2 superfamily
MKRSTRHPLFILAIAMILCGTAVIFAKQPERAPTAAEEVILQWNRVLGQTLQVPDIHPGNILPVRSFAMMHLAMFDAVNSIDSTYTPYLTDVPGPRGATAIKIAAAKAAYDVLSALYPGQRSVFDAEFAISLDGAKPNRSAMRVGELAAATILANRANDGWSAPWTPYLLPTTPGNWQELFPGPYPGFAVFTNYPGVRPFALSSGTQFLPSPPPALSSAEYATAFNEVKDLGDANSTRRTADQALTAFLWANPPVSDALMFGVARSTAIARNNSTVENARLFALVYMAFHDALQTTFTSQYHYGLWRPVTAIRRANEDGNPDTAQDANWDSLLGTPGTPPHPSYASNASSASSSLATTLGLFYGRDNVQFQIDFGGNPNVTRNYRTFSALTNEIARSRVYGGVHFPFDIVEGQAAGRNVATFIFLHYLKPRDCNF